MTPIPKTGSIIVTHYTNPQLFWFKYRNNVLADEFLLKLERKVRRHMEESNRFGSKYSHSPKIGELVLVNYCSDTETNGKENKWIRARVDHQLKYSKGVQFILWLIDYGFPLQSESRWIRELQSDELKTINDQFIFKAGLYNIVPATANFNFETSNTDMVKTKTWSPNAIEIVEKLIYDADTLTFRCAAYLNDHFFGSLVVQSNKGSKTYVDMYLRNMQEAVDSNTFVKEFKKLNHQPYWERQNDGSIYKIQENSCNESVQISNDPLRKSSNVSHSLRHHQLNQLNGFDNSNASSTVYKLRFEKNDFEHSKQTENEEITMAPLNLCDNFAVATNSSVKIDSAITTKIRNIRIDQTQTVKNKQPVVLSPIAENIPIVPMNKRFAIAQQKFLLKCQDEFKENEEGFLVTNPVNVSVPINVTPNEDPWVPHIKIKTKTDNNDINASLMNEKSTLEATDCTNLKNNDSYYKKALDNEFCFTANHKQHILVHDHEHTPITAMKHVSEAHFSPIIHAALQARNYNQIYRIQTIGWPCIMRGGSFIVVNSAKTGKTWTYMPAMCSIIIERMEDKQIVEGNGPAAIIVCTSSSEVEKIADYCKQLFRKTEIVCVKAYGFYEEAKVLSLLLNGAEILVTTVPCLHRLLMNQLGLFNKERIVTIVFEKIDLVYDRFPREIRDIYKTFCESNSTIQTIVTARTWHKILELFYKELNNLTLCIGAYIEASVYARTEMSVELVEHKFKEDRITSYLRDGKYQLELTLIICNESKEVEILLEKLRHLSIAIWHCHENSDSCDIVKIKELIKHSSSSELSLLICTDDVLPDLDVRHAQHIVHYSLPSTWSSFTFRFSASLDHHQNLLLKKTLSKSPATSLVFIDENNNEELPRLIDFMQNRGGVHIPEKIIKFAEKKRIENEEQRSNIYKPFCNTLLTNGICHGQSSCQQRHVLTKFDRSSEDIPRSGSVKFEIIATHTPVHFTVRLLEHRPLNDTNWIAIRSANDFLSFSIEFSNYFNNPDNHIIHYPCNLGDLCVVCIYSTMGSMHYRGKIIKIDVEKSKTFLNPDVDVLLIDTNTITTHHSTELMQLPQRFKTFPHQAVDVRIAGVVPHDFDYEWDSKTLEDVKNWLRHGENYYSKGDIQLSIMNTLWIHSVDVMEILHSIGHEIISVSIKNNLLRHNFGVRDSKAIELMRSLAEKADLLNVQKLHQPHAELSFTDQLSQVVDCRKIADSAPFHNSCASSLFDESDDSRLNWTTTTDDDDENDCNTAAENLNDSSSAKSEPLLRKSNDKWSELLPNQFNKVYLCSFFHPNRFYIRNNDVSSRSRFGLYPSVQSRLRELNEQIDAISCNVNPLVDVEVAVNCLAELQNKLRRAKILKIFNSSDGQQMMAEVFFVDFGEFNNVPLNELIQIPIEFIEILPFQAIFCKMIGIRPINNSLTWSDSVCDDIYDIFDKNAYFYARAMQVGELDRYTYGLKCHSYEVVCVDQNVETNINNQILLNHYAEYDPASMHFIDIIVDKMHLRQLDNDTDEEDNKLACVDSDYALNNFEIDLDIQFDDDDIAKLLFQDGMLYSYEEQNQPPPLVIEEINEQKPSCLSEILEEKFEDDLFDGKLSSDNDDDEDEPPLLLEIPQFGGLIHSSTIPNIKWQQTHALITLTMFAPDVLDYYLKITPSLVHFCYEKDGDKFSAVLNLFGCIDVAYTSHEIRGLNIIVRLVKTLYGLDWPRLLENTDKHRWLHYNLDAKFEKFDEFRLDNVSTNDNPFDNDWSSSSSENEYESDGIN